MLRVAVKKVLLVVGPLRKENFFLELEKLKNKSTLVFGPQKNFFAASLKKKSQSV